MTFSITQRLTLLVALLSAVVLIPAGVALYVSGERGIRARGMENANTTALMVGTAILRQLDEDILVDFARKKVAFDALRVPCDHWAVIRSNGIVEAVGGMFGQDPSIALLAGVETKRIFEGQPYALGIAPLVHKRFVQWDGISQAAQDAVTANTADGVFLNVKTERSGDLNLVAAKWLFPDHVLEVEVTEAGLPFKTDKETLPKQLPADMEIHTPSGRPLLSPEIVDWRTYNGELIAIVQGHLQNAEPIRVAVNRLGEHYLIAPDGRIAQALEDSRLQVVVAHNMSPGTAQARHLAWTTAIGGVLVWLLMVLIAWQVTRHALKPVNEIVRQVQKIDPLQLSQRLPVGPVDDELARITRTVNQMLDRIEAGYRRERQFTGDASHEMRNPLAKMLAEIDLALSKPRDNRHYLETVERLRRYVLDMQRLAESLLILARLEGRLEELPMERFDLADLSVEVVRGLPPHATQRVQLELGQSQDPMQVTGHRRLIGVLLRNLLDNALRYSPQDSPVHVRIHRNCASVRIEVEDHGPGIPAEDRALAFNRFHRLERSRSKQTGGVGLGLSIARAIADVHGTTVTLGSANGSGTLASFTLPSINGDDKVHRARA